MPNGNDKPKDTVEVKGADYYYNEETKNTTIVLTKKHYNFLQSVRHNEMKNGGRNVNMSFIVKEAIELYEKYYAEKHSVRIDDKGFIK